MSKRKTVIIGGVAGGATCAARLRRLDSEREIIILERNDYISYANCGLPYYIGNVIQNRGALFLMSPEIMEKRFQIDVRIKNEVLSIDKDKRIVLVKKLDTDEVYEESYDDLVISTGSTPLRPNIKGIESDKILTLWNIADTDRIRKMVEQDDVHKVAVIGGGFIGLEMAENLHHQGLQVSLIEALDQVMSPIDIEMANILHQNIRKNGIDLLLGDGVASFEESNNQVLVKLQSGKVIDVDFVILSIGVRPNSILATNAGIKTNARGGIIVDSSLRTSDKNIYAIGDVIEVEDYIFKESTMIPLAGPANKQGRILADILAGRSSLYKGTQGSSIVKVFDLTVASTGVNEKTLVKKGLKKGIDYESFIIVQNSHAGYYPGSTPMTIKVLFSLDTKKILGAQIVGIDGVDKRIDTIGVVIRLNGTILDLKDLELAYAPPYSSAKDPVNMVGFVAENILTGLVKIAEYNVVEKEPQAFLLDVRERREVDMYSVPNALNVPLGELRNNLNKLNKDDRIIIFCGIGVRAYTASRILSQNGFKNVEVYPGGVRFYSINYPR